MRMLKPMVRSKEEYRDVPYSYWNAANLKARRGRWLRCREIARLYEQDGLTMEKIGMALGVSTSNVWIQYYVWKHKLSKLDYLVMAPESGLDEIELMARSLILYRGGLKSRFITSIED